MKSLRDSTLKVFFRGLKAIEPPRTCISDYRTARYLVISTTAIGDTLLGTPALRALKETNPAAWVGVLAQKGRMEVLDGNPHVDEVIPFEKGAFNLRRIGRTLKDKRIDVVLIFHGNDPWTLPVAWLSGARGIIGYREDTSFDFLLTRAIPLPPAGNHAVDRRLALTRAVGADTTDRKLVLTLQAHDRSLGNNILKEMGLGDASLIVGLQPGAAKTYKCWPLEHFARLGRSLVQETGAQVVITGSPQEAAMADKLRGMIGDGAVSAAGRTGIRGMAALIERMTVYVTNDTGPMHIAFAVGAPTVSLFCPSDAESLKATAEEHKHTVISKPRPCVPCVTKQCKDPFCMEQITVDEVFEAVKELLLAGAPHAAHEGIPPPPLYPLLGKEGRGVVKEGERGS